MIAIEFVLLSYTKDTYFIYYTNQCNITYIPYIIGVAQLKKVRELHYGYGIYMNGITEIVIYPEYFSNNGYK